MDQHSEEEKSFSQSVWSQSNLPSVRSYDRIETPASLKIPNFLGSQNYSQSTSEIKYSQTDDLATAVNGMNTRTSTSRQDNFGSTDGEMSREIDLKLYEGIRETQSTLNDSSDDALAQHIAKNMPGLQIGSKKENHLSHVIDWVHCNRYVSFKD